MNRTKKHARQQAQNDRGQFLLSSGGQFRMSLDTFLGLAKTCAKQGIAFWDYLGSRLNVQGQAHIASLPELVRCRGQSA